MEVFWGKYIQDVIFVLLNNCDKCTHCYLCGADNHPPKNVHQNQTRETVEINELIEKLFYNCKILLDAICISCFKYKFVYFFGKKYKQTSAHHQQ